MKSIVFYLAIILISMKYSFCWPDFYLYTKKAPEGFDLNKNRSLNEYSMLLKCIDYIKRILRYWNF